MDPAATQLSYVLPLRWSADDGLPELVGYLRRLASQVAEIVVVDGSAGPLFARHAVELDGVARHMAPDPRFSFRMGKVDGVTTGVYAARGEKVLLADDDVRYEPPELRRIEAMLDGADLVRPQNYFDPLPWHARLDTARSLLNRVHSGDPELGAGDFPGTLGVRRSTFVATGGYDGDVMFENLELMRTVTAAGGTVATPLDLYVRRLPPSTSHFRSQRVRQAYDDFAVPLRMGAFLLVVPLLAWGLATRSFRTLGLGAAATVGVAEAGRRRAGGRDRFAASSALLAPAWVLERGVSAWLAVYRRLRGGVGYADRRIVRSASSPAELRRRFTRADESGVSRGTEPDLLVGAVAERPEAGPPTAA